MKFELHVYHHYPRDPVVARELASLRQLLENRMSDIDDFLNRLIADVSAQKTQIASLTALTTALKHKVADALAGESLSTAAKDKLAAIFPAIEANTADIASAINANTDAAPATVADPAPPATPLVDAPASLGQAGGTKTTSDPNAA
jgi:hypothetical protein